ncbi:hypothetical protein BGV46_06520 [Serratia marcescens]|nr:phage protein [Serratia marcescens]OHT36830.1 hypothetical protein BGV45_06525 [Serratia marcescens]OHT39426.1 hypothetical protein BGV46_06520 [Serratia marcescens]
MVKKHHMKIHPEHLAAVNCGAKRAEFRINDRDFAVGDLLSLNGYTKFGHLEGFTGEHIWVRITHITDLAEWAPGYVMLSIERGPFKC